MPCYVAPWCWWALHRLRPMIEFRGDPAWGRPGGPYTMGQARFAPLGMPLPFQAPKRKILGGLGDSVPQMLRRGCYQSSSHPRCLLLPTTDARFVFL